MRIVVHVSKYYDWEPLPAGVEPTESDVRALRVKPALDGRWLMRVTRAAETHTTVLLPEHEIVKSAIADKVRNGETLTRHEVVARYLASRVMPHHAHRSWFTRIEVEDDGPSAELHAEHAQRHVDAGHIEMEDVADMLGAYMVPKTPTELAEHLHAHFGVRP